MKLLRLLSAGRSLVGLKDAGNRYRPSDKGALPVFRPVQHSFRKTASSKGSAAAYETKVAPSTAPAESSAFELPAQQGQKQNFPDAVSPPAITQQRSVESDGQRVGCERPSLAGGGNGEIAKAGWFRCWPFHKRKTSGIPPLPKKPVPLQGELSLDNVKVVRNDLRDSDLDLVPVGSVKRARKAAPVDTEMNRLGNNMRCT